MSHPDGHFATITPSPITTAGEVFADGSMIELIGGASCAPATNALGWFRGHHCAGH
jgi:hypothetical protein